MRYAIISDIHSNLEALQVTVDELKRRKISKVICLGDIVGYGANPNECCNIARELSECTVMGNHDAGSTGAANLSYFNSEAREACIWTAKVLTPENKGWLRKLPLKLTYDSSFITHSSPSTPERWHYILSVNEAVDEFSFFKNVCFIGHTHVPITFVKMGPKYNIITSNKFLLSPEYQYMINPGSIGQPRDMNNQSSFAVYDFEIKEVEIVRLPYDIDSAQKKILSAGLPEHLAKRLLTGE